MATTNNLDLIHPDCEKTQRATKMIVATNKDTNKVNTKDCRGFLFDIIVVRLDIPSKTINDTSKLLVDANFNGNDINLSSSRINVLDFKAERSFEFVANPLTLKEELSSNPLRLKVMEESTVLGYGRIEWPEELLTGLIECAGEMTYSLETELKECDGARTGTIQVFIRLQPKCEEYVDYTDGKCRNVNKAIDPNDILFVVGEDKNTCCCSQVGIIPASDSDQDLVPKCLDLSNFRAVNSQNVNNTNILDSLDPACQKLKEVTNHYQKLIDAVMTKGKENPCTEKSHKEKYYKFFTIPPDSSLKINVIPSSSDSYTMPIHCSSDIRAFAAKHVKQIAHIETPPDMVDHEPEALRCCPLCKEDMTFLPKLAACPNCCYKPVPYFEEKPYNDAQSADQILKEYQDKLQTNDNTSSDTNLKEQTQCRCTCKYGSNKPCAHCRIRKLCEHIFQSPLQTVQPNDEVDAKTSDLQCASSDNRPFLTRIFSELKDLYDIKEPKKKQFEPDDRCERELNKEPPTKNQSQLKKYHTKEEQKNDYEKVKEISKPQKCGKFKKRSLKPASEKAVKSKLYDYQLVRQNNERQIGHKTCINGFAGRKNVPPNMGWLWNINNCGKWKPGAIRKPIKELMKYFLKDFPADTLLVSQYSYSKNSKSRNSNVPPQVSLEQKPTLYIHKKNGEYIITMRPLKPLEVLKEAADPYENMKPIQFRIVKNPQLEAIRNIKKSLKEMGFKKCTCHRPIIFCYCRTFLEKKKLEYLCNKECCKRQLESCSDTLVLSDTSDSEAEFDFGVTPPVGVIKPEKLKKVNLVNVGTQYAELDWNPEPLFPRPPNKYMQMYQCAVGERKAPASKGGVQKAGSKSVGGALRSGTCPKGAGGFVGVKGMAGGFVGVKGVGGGKGMAGGFVGVKGVGGKGMVGKNMSGKGEGDGLVMGKTGINGGPSGFDTPKRKVDMLKYSMKIAKNMAKISPAEAAAKRRERMNLLRGTNPPLLCMVDRRGKPLNPCDPCFPCGDNRIC